MYNQNLIHPGTTQEFQYAERVDVLCHKAVSQKSEHGTREQDYFA